MSQQVQVLTLAQVRAAVDDGTDMLARAFQSVFGDALAVTEERCAHHALDFPFGRTAECLLAGRALDKFDAIVRPFEPGRDRAFRVSARYIGKSGDEYARAVMAAYAAHALAFDKARSHTNPKRAMNDAAGALRRALCAADERRDRLVDKAFRMLEKQDAREWAIGRELTRLTPTARDAREIERSKAADDFARAAARAFARCYNQDEARYPVAAEAGE